MGPLLFSTPQTDTAFHQMMGRNQRQKGPLPSVAKAPKRKGTNAIPPMVTWFAAQVKEVTGVESTVETLNSKAWRLTTDSDRVRLTVQFLMDRTGYVDHEGSTLEVDGKPQALADSFAELGNVFRNPDASTAERKRITPPPMLPARDISDAPYNVRHFHHVVRTKIPADWRLSVGYAKGTWTVRIEAESTGPEGTVSTLRQVSYRKLKANVWGICGEPGVLVITDGVDRSPGKLTDPGAALQVFLAGVKADSPPAPGTPAPTKAPIRQNSVEVRRHAVIRN